MENQVVEQGQVESKDQAEDFVEPTIIYAGFWARFFATVLDNIIFSLVLWVVFLLSYDIVATARIVIIAGQDVDIQKEIYLSVITMILTVLFWKYRSATPGKIMMGLSVVDATTGGAPTTTMLIVRYFSYLVSIIPLCLGFIWVAFDKRKQGFHDKIANTVVIVNPPEVDEE